MRGLYTEKITDDNKIDMFKSILGKIKPEITEKLDIEQFHDDGEGEDRIYNVYKIIAGEEKYILKKSEDNEIKVYEKFLLYKNLPVPKLEGWTCVGNTKWILIEYIKGQDLRNFNEGMAHGCAESLAKIFNTYWQESNFEGNKLDNRFERYWTRINKRAQCLKNEPKLSSAYKAFLDRQLVCPRTLCNGDFLQFNVIESKESIVLIDWAFAGIMPYSLDIARLISHGSEKYFPFPFYMTDEYRKIFVKGVYERLIYKPNYKQFIWDVILSCLNECIEFIERELKDDTMERDEGFDYYYKNAEALADIILKGKEHLVV
ncbi:aminoglycoside phosphotransferase family protein [Clostridium tunisiense]|uniref:aminoglycoside phosphotransferase family protein n=1 Tax=Clostridium tunisiense TaxID=219748 RepID=UPI00031BB709|nr:aminoglycoside phosphotransferase family protein [Clostridium tunisiense]